MGIGRRGRRSFLLFAFVLSDFRLDALAASFPLLFLSPPAPYLHQNRGAEEGGGGGGGSAARVVTVI